MVMTAGKVRVRVKVAGKAPTKPRVRVRLAGKDKPKACCISWFCCSACKPDCSMALAMGLHARLGEASPLANLTDDLLRKIIANTKPSRWRSEPAWMSCSWTLQKT